MNASRKYKHRHPSGVSLLEVMFAIGVVGIGLLGVAALLPIAGQQVGMAHVADMASVVGRNAFREIDIRGYKRLDMWIDGTGNAYTPPNATTAFCIDPLYVATNGASTLGNMTRVNVRAQAGGTTGLSLAEADLIFRSHDELTFDKPDEQLDPATQKYVTNGTTELRREDEGRMSWFATIVPKRENDGNTSADLFTLSVVVALNRPLTPSAENEATFGVSNIRSSVAGGDFKLDASFSQLDVREGNWVMLIGNGSTPNAYRWFRVVAMNEATRDLTLYGGDWEYAANNTQVVVVRGVVAVFEKTIRLETSSLWAY